MTTFEAFAVSCACAFFLGAMLAWALRAWLVEARDRRFVDWPEPVVSIRTLVDADGWADICDEAFTEDTA